MADDQEQGQGLLGQAVGGIDPALLDQLTKRLMTPTPVVRPDQTPVEHDWRYYLSRLGNAMGGAGVVDTLSPTQQRAAGLRALGDFSTGLMASAHYVPGKTIFSNLGQGFEAADRSVLGSEREGAQVLAARQAALTEAQKQQIEGIKAALPLLQQQGALRGLPGSLLGNTPNVGTGGSIATSGTFFDALAQIESGDQDIVSRVDKDSQGRTLAQGGNPAEISQGRFQINPGTWLRYAKQAGIDTSQYPNPLKAPKEVQAAVASVIPLREFGPRTQRLLRERFGDLDTNKTVGALAGSRAAPPTQPGASTPTPPQVAPGQATPPAQRGTLPPPEPAMGGPSQTAMGPGEEGTTQVAGKTGAPTGTTIPASPPGSPGVVAAITEGMVAAGADPNTLAPGPGSRPGAPPAVATAQLSPLPPGMDANSREAYGILHPIVPPPEMQKLFNPGPDPEQLAAIAVRKQNAERDYQAARLSKDPVAASAKARELFDKATADENTLRENARKLGVDTQANYYKERQAALDAAWTAEQKQRADEKAAARTQQNELDRIDVTARAARETEAARQEGQVIVDERKDMAKVRDAARQSIDQVHVLRALSDRAGTATALENLTLPNGQTVRDLMVQHGLGDEKTLAHLSSQQAYEAAAGQMVMDLRRGVQMGSLSDRDLLAVQKLVPKGSVTPEGRANILATIENAHIRNRDYIDRVHQLWDQGKGLSWEKAKVEADKQMGDIVPQVPQEYNTMSDQQRDVWWKANAKPLTLMRTPDELNKDGKVTKRGHIILIPEAPSNGL